MKSKIEKKKSWRGGPLANLQIQIEVNMQIQNTIRCTKIQMMTKLGRKLKNKKSWRGALMAEIQIQIKVDIQIQNTIKCTKIQMMTTILEGKLKN